MSRLVCHLDKGWQTMLCVNNYRGKDYGKPEDSVECKDCWVNPDNKGLQKDHRDPDKVKQKEASP